MKHTRGPWSAFIRERTAQVDCGSEPTGKSKCVVAWTGFDSSGQSMERQKANARLIAASPRLLSILKRIVESVPHGASHDALFNEAKTEIAKAEGPQ